MFFAHRLMMVYICTKVHENILNGIRVMERTRKVNGRMDVRTDRRTDGGHDIIRPVFDTQNVQCSYLLFSARIVMINVMKSKFNVFEQFL